MIKRIQFPQAPSGTINATQRMQLGVGLVEVIPEPSENTILLSNSNKIVRKAGTQTIVRVIHP